MHKQISYSSTPVTSLKVKAACRVFVKQIRIVKWLYLLNEMKHGYNYCTSSKPTHYNLLSHSTIGPILLYTILQPIRPTLNAFPSEAKKEQRKRYLELLFAFIRCLIGRLHLWSNPTKRNHMEQIGTSRRPFYWSTTPNPPTRKMVVKRDYKWIQVHHAKWRYYLTERYLATMLVPF